MSGAGDTVILMVFTLLSRVRPSLGVFHHITDGFWREADRGYCVSNFREERVCLYEDLTVDSGGKLVSYCITRRPSPIGNHQLS